MTALEYIRELNRAEGFLELSMAEDAFSVLDELPRFLRVRPEVILLRVRTLLFMGHRKEAEAIAEDGVASNPGSGDALFCLAMAQAQLGKRASAKHSITAALLLNPSLRQAAEEVIQDLSS